MKAKILLRFYFNVDELEKSLNCVMYRQAFSSHDAFLSADNIVKVIEQKSLLAELWRYIDGVIANFNEEDKATLREYAVLRTGVAKLPDEVRKRYRRVVVRFIRRCRSLKKFTPNVKCVADYVALF